MRVLRVLNYLVPWFLLLWNAIKPWLQRAHIAVRTGGDVDFVVEFGKSVWFFVESRDEHIIPTIGFVWLIAVTYPQWAPIIFKSKIPKKPEPENTHQVSSIPAPEVTPRGGEDFTLEIRAMEDGRYYGCAWLSGKGVTNLSKFDLDWAGSSRRSIRKRDVFKIKIADLKRRHSYQRALRVWGIDPIPVHKDESWGNLRHYKPHPTDWLRLFVEIRAREAEEIWEHQYNFRMKDRNTFEVEEVEG